MKTFQQYLREGFDFYREFDWGSNQPEYNDHQWQKGKWHHTAHFRVGENNRHVVVEVAENGGYHMVNYYMGTGPDGEGPLTVLDNEAIQDIKMRIVEVFSNIMTMCLELYKHVGGKGFLFSASQGKQEEMYDRLFEMRNFQRAVNNLGFYTQKHAGMYFIKSNDVPEDDLP